MCVAQICVKKTHTQTNAKKKKKRERNRKVLFSTFNMNLAVLNFLSKNVKVVIYVSTEQTM